MSTWKTPHPSGGIPRVGGRGFSLIEVAIALGVASFVLITLLALLPLGVKTNQTSYEETQAVGLISLVEADIRNSHPRVVPNGRSWVYGLLLPYGWNGTSMRRTLAVSAATATSTGIDDAGLVVPHGSGALPRYQVTVVYTTVPPPGGRDMILARVIVNWPCLPGASSTPNAAQLALTSDLSRVSGFVESLVAFPAP